MARLTKLEIEALEPGRSITAHCSDTAEYNSAYQVALYYRKTRGLTPDQLPIKTDSKGLTVTVTKPGGEFKNELP